jgi:hypothetical protein
MSLPSSGSKDKPSRKQHEAGSKESSFFAYSSTLKMDANSSSESSADYHQSTLRYIQEEGTFNKEQVFSKER